MSRPYTTALAKLDDAIGAIEMARDDCSDHPSLTGAGTPNSHGHFGQSLDDLQVLRGRVANADEVAV